MTLLKNERTRTREIIEQIEERHTRGKERLAEKVGGAQAEAMIEKVREAELVGAEFDVSAIDSFVCPGKDEIESWNELERIIDIYRREAERGGVKLRLKLTPVDLH